MITLKDYGFTSDIMPESCKESFARVTVVHKERHALICEHGETYGRLKPEYTMLIHRKVFPQPGTL